MNMRASELRIFFLFIYSKTAISFNILLVLQILCLRNICISGLHLHLHRYTINMINGVPFMVYGTMI